MPQPAKPPGLQNIKKRILSGGIWVTGGFVINAFAGLFIGILLSRILPSNDVGNYFLIFSIATSAAVLGQLGMNRAIVRFTAGFIASGEPGRARATAVRCLVIIILVCIAYILLMSFPASIQLFNSLFPDTGLGAHVFIVGIWAGANTLRRFLAELSRGAHNIKLAALTQRILVNVFLLCGLLIAWLVHIDASLLQILIFATASTLLVATIALIKNITWIHNQPRGLPESYRTIYQASAPLFLSQGLQLLMTQFPIWILGALHAGSNVAFFGVATRTTLFVSMPLLIANNVIMPLVAALYKSGHKEKLRTLLSVSVTVTSVASTIMALVFFGFGEAILGILYGDEYVQGYTPLVILTFGAVLNVYAGSATVLLAMSGNEQWVLKSVAISAFVSVATGFILVQSMDATGAALASSLGLILYNLLISLKARSITGISSFISPAAVKMFTHQIIKNRQ